MPAQPTTIKLPTLAGGVSKTAPTKRRPDQVEEADNVFLSLERGLEKRQGTDFIEAEGTSGSLNISDLPSDPDDMLFHTFRLKKNKAVIVVVIPGAATANVVQFFDASTGAKQTYSSLNTAGKMAAFATYLQLGSTVPLKDRIRFTRVKDALLILNTEAEARFLNTGAGAALAYRAPYAISAINGNAYPDGSVNIHSLTSGNVAARNTMGMLASDFNSGNTYSLEYKDSEFRDRRAATASATVVDYQNSISVQSFLELGESPDAPRFLITTQEGQDADYQEQWPVLRTPFVRNETDVRTAFTALHDSSNIQSVTYTIDGSTYGIGESAGEEVPSTVMGHQLMGNPKKGDGFIFYVRESSPGAPSGFYRVISTAEDYELPIRDAADAHDLNYFDRTHEHTTSYSMGGFSEGAPYYQRVRTEGIGSVLDRTRMPYILAFNGDAASADFALDEGPWTPRLSGDNSSNPGPSFIANTDDPYSTSAPTGAKITAMGYWRNRLWLASGTTIVCSQAGSPYNLWINDVETISDNDPIDLDINESDASRIQWIIPFEAALFIGTDGSEQFSLTGSDNFVSPLTVALDSTVEYSLSPDAEPLKVGNNLYFTDAGRLFLYVGQGRGLNASFSIGESVLGYFPESVPQAITAASQDMTLFRSADTGEDNMVYVYHQRQLPNGQIGQAAYYRWIFLNPLYHISVLGNDLVNVTYRDSKMFLEKMSLNAVTITDSLLDRKATPTVVYNTAAATTKLQLPYLATDPTVVRTSDYATITPTSTETDSVTGNTILNLSGDVSDETYVVGEKFNMSVTLSPLVLRDGSNTHVDAHLQLKDLATRHYKSGTYDIAVTRKNRVETVAKFDPYRTTNPFTTDDNNYYQLNGQAQARLAGNADDISIVLRSDGHVPVNITNVEARVMAQVGRDAGTE